MHNHATSTGLLSASGALSGASPYLPAGLCAIMAVSDGTHAMTASVTDGAGGILLGQVDVPAGSNSAALVYHCPVVANKQLYLNLSGTGASAAVIYLLG